MVRFLVLYDAPDDPEAFDRHYREVHIPLAKKVPGLRRYMISRDDAGIRGGGSYYLVAELDWDDMAALRHAFSSPEGQATAADVPRFAGEVCVWFRFANVRPHSEAGPHRLHASQRSRNSGPCPGERRGGDRQELCQCGNWQHARKRMSVADGDTRPAAARRASSKWPGRRCRRVVRRADPPTR